MQVFFTVFSFCIKNNCIFAADSLSFVLFLSLQTSSETQKCQNSPRRAKERIHSDGTILTEAGFGWVKRVKTYRRRLLDALFPDEL